MYPPGLPRRKHTPIHPQPAPYRPSHNRSPLCPPAAQPAPSLCATNCRPSTRLSCPAPLLRPTANHTPIRRHKRGALDKGVPRTTPGILIRAWDGPGVPSAPRVPRGREEGEAGCGPSTTRGGRRLRSKCFSSPRGTVMWENCVRFMGASAGGVRSGLGSRAGPPALPPLWPMAKAWGCAWRGGREEGR